MATRKKKTETTISEWPKVTVGTHLTVTTYENGKTELKWDDEALARDVRDAIADYQAKQVKKKSSKTKAK